MERILVIGGTGNIGFPLIERLISKNIEVVAGVLHPEKAKAKFSELPQVKTVQFDFLNPETFNGALDQVDRVFFVRPPQLADPERDMFPFLQAIKAQNVKQVVFVSLIGVEKNPMTPHHKIEKEIKRLELPYTFIRPSFFMQNLNTTHLEDIQKQHVLFVPAGRAKTSFIDTRDIGAVAAACMTTDKYLGTELEITGGEALTYAEAATIMSQILDEKITYSKPSLLKFRRTMIKRGTPKEFVNVMVMLYLITQLGNAKKVTSTLTEVLGRPATTFEQYVQDYREVFLS
ncbi:NmrA family protein [Enterococcus canis]|uniref:NmrA family protein n=1 Tax=Enterococcus canis TaxID=214095 RepID=A0A1L8RI77_9ENTE|nr:SDR family oxidoreductase [Enterococcus canis]OJG19469.1 NmrA family protein [Enterococcus canis]